MQLTSTTAFTLLSTLLFATSANALAKNAYDACNGGNHYDLNHCCAFGSGSGPVSVGRCTLASGVLICDPSLCPGNCGCPPS